jgi:hypothetical protein
MTSDDQMEFELSVDSHIPVTRDRVEQLLRIIVLSGKQDEDYDMCCKFLEPVLEYEYQIIRDCLFDKTKA